MRKHPLKLLLFEYVLQFIAKSDRLWNGLVSHVCQVRIIYYLKYLIIKEKI